MSPEQYGVLRAELIEGLKKAIDIGLKIDVSGMDNDTAANHVLDVLQAHNCLRKTHETPANSLDCPLSRVPAT